MELTDEERERIRIEERYRVEVRQQLLNREQNSHNHILAFLNTSLGLWILSAVFISGMGTAYQCYEKQRDETKIRVAREVEEEHATLATAARLDREISYRFSQLLIQLQHSAGNWGVDSPSPGTDWRHLPEPYLAYLARGNQDAINVIDSNVRAPDKTPQYDALYPDYSQRSLPSLIAELGLHVDPKAQLALDNARKQLLDLRRGNDFVAKPTPPAEQMAALVLARCVLPRWRNNAFQYTHCSPDHPFCD